MSTNGPEYPADQGNAKLRVEGLSNIILEADLRQLFQPHGSVVSATIVPDAKTGLGSGAGFVEMRSNAEASVASATLNGSEHLGRKLTVTEAGGNGNSGDS